MPPTINVGLTVQTVSVWDQRLVQNKERGDTLFITDGHFDYDWVN